MCVSGCVWGCVCESRCVCVCARVRVYVHMCDFARAAIAQWSGLRLQALLGSGGQASAGLAPPKPVLEKHDPCPSPASGVFLTHVGPLDSAAPLPSACVSQGASLGVSPWGHLPLQQWCGRGPRPPQGGLVLSNNISSDLFTTKATP